jgi:hypothetical protein
MVENRGRGRANAIDLKQQFLGALTKTDQHRCDVISKYSSGFFAQTSCRDILVLPIQELPEKKDLFGFRRSGVLGITGRYSDPHGIERVAIEKRGRSSNQGKNEDERAYDEVCVRQHTVHSILLFLGIRLPAGWCRSLSLAAKPTFLMMCTGAQENWLVLYTTKRSRYQGSK